MAINGKNCASYIKEKKPLLPNISLRSPELISMDQEDDSGYALIAGYLPTTMRNYHHLNFNKLIISN